MTIGSLFSGIGALEMGLEWAGLGPVLWQVEINPFCRDVLARHWPEVTRYDDVRAVGAACLAPVDLVCAGFPCTDISSAGKGAGLAGERSGLWRECARVVSELSPSWVVVENVASGAKRWVDAVVRDLEQRGYAVLPVPLSAFDVGAPHRRARIFLVAHAHRDRKPFVAVDDEVGGARAAAGPSPHALGPRLQGPRAEGPTGRPVAAERAWADDAMPRPALCRVDDGPAAWVDRTDRIRALGNSVVPQCAEVIGHIVRLLDEEGV